MNALPQIYQQLLDCGTIRCTTAHVQLGDRNFTLIDVKAFDLYKNNAMLRAHVPRGLCFVIWESKIVHVLSGMKKENGECFHLSAFSLEDGAPYLVFGSKNVHLMVRTAYEIEDMSGYIGGRYMYAKRVATQLLTTVAMEWVTDYLVQNRCTFVAMRLAFFAITMFDNCMCDPPTAQTVFASLNLNTTK